MEADRRRMPAPLPEGEERARATGHKKFPSQRGDASACCRSVPPQLLGVSRATVERLVSQGQLPVVKVGASTRYDVRGLDEFIATNRYRDRRRLA
jgi:excisionase family DNA binding protein